MSKIAKNIDSFFTRYYPKKRVFTETIELLEKNGYEKLVYDWNNFCSELFLKEKKCLTNLHAFWFKFPVLLNDFKRFKGKEVIDVGGMCGLSAFLAYHVGEAKSVKVIEYNKDYCDPCVDLLKNYSEGNITVHQKTFLEFFSKYEADNNSAIYLSDILYQFRQPDIDVLSKAIKNSSLVIAHSRENKPVRNKNNYNFSRHQNIANYFFNLGKKVSYPNNKSPDSIRNKETSRNDITKVNPWKTWITVVGE